MSSLIRFISWTVAIGNRGAAANAWRAIEEREQAEATLDALSARMSGAPAGALPLNDEPPSSTRTAPSRAA